MGLGKTVHGLTVNPHSEYHVVLESKPWDGRLENSTGLLVINQWDVLFLFIFSVFPLKTRPSQYSLLTEKGIKP